MKAAAGFSIAVVLAGVWIGVAPFVVGYAPGSGSPLTGAVSMSVGMGLAVALAGLIGLVGFSGGRLGELQRALQNLSLAERDKVAADIEAKESTTGSKDPSIRLEPAAMDEDDSAPHDTEAKLQALVERVLQDYHNTGSQSSRG